ncbi:hypothetical protein [Pelotomaculum propionicicum]|uniref:Uncharacterized protein n=1 Tax=Pelotomaculum propionicicum TaxID=258475 RepID=A0A4Y7RWP2_9FIRM|nr:hypothetical protein [Pelotomaculum propionicicum]NLI12493.1 hypothetical protein [Peptococcaceae bacterium]TEB13404.1 hypothetical protein Pmgp_00298 [Pelotomaculum propionicicum]
MSIASVQKQPDTTARLNNIKAMIEKGKTEKAKAEANLESFTKQRNDVIAELKALGVDPENLDTEIAKLAREEEEALARAEELLRG